MIQEIHRGTVLGQSIPEFLNIVVINTAIVNGGFAEPPDLDCEIIDFKTSLFVSNRNAFTREKWQSRRNCAMPRMSSRKPVILAHRLDPPSGEYRASLFQIPETHTR
jgi:hypothetical protein